MSYADRRDLYRDIEQERERPLLSYVTSSRPGARGGMGSDVIPHFIKQLSILEDEGHDEIDLLVVSYGGDPTVAWRIITLIREHFNHVSILLPDSAYSAATLLALGADDVVMHSFANLGPVDPQITYIEENGDRDRRVSFGSEDLRHFINFVREDLGITDQEQMEKAFEFACEEIGATKIGAARRSSHLSVSLGEKLLKQHMADEKEASAIAEALSKSFHHHGYPLSRTEAEEEIGLPISEPDNPVRGLMREVWEDFEEEMKCNQPFSPRQVVLSSDEADKLLQGTEQVNIPAGLDQQTYKQLQKQILQQIDIVTVEPVDYSVFQSAVESDRAYSHYRQDGKIFARRLPDGGIKTNRVVVKREWDFVDNP